ncbi:MAG: hypothetical protein H8E59_04360 [Actinobacteria bacterium]|nr:hypothetical protein [Actinomycetota bacterium]
MALQHPRGGVAGTVIAGRYRLVDLIGGTTHTEVWAGHDAVLERPVTVKFVHAGDVATGAARLTLAGVAAVFDVTDHDGLAVVVTERVDAVPLDQLLDRQPHLSSDDVVTLVTAVAGVLEAAHGAGVPHGAIRPSNVLVREDGTVLLTDFRGAGDGGPGPFDPRADLEALAILLAELLAHCPRSDVPTYLRQFVDRALTAPESQRPVGMLDFRMALRPDDAVPGADEGRPLMRRRLSGAVLSLLLVAALVVAVVVTTALLGAGWTLVGWD